MESTAAQRLEAIEALHSKVASPLYRTAINLDRPWDCAGCGEGHRWPCATVKLIRSEEELDLTPPEPEFPVRRAAPSAKSLWEKFPELWALQQEANRSRGESRWARIPQETFSPDADFEELPEQIRRQCCVGKTCGVTDLLKEHSAGYYSYVRASNGEHYFGADSVEELVAQLNDPTYWPNCW